MTSERCLATNCSRKWFSVVHSVPADEESSVKVLNGLIGCSRIDPGVYLSYRDDCSLLKCNRFCNKDIIDV